jgi:hypothetical protein
VDHQPQRRQVDAASGDLRGDADPRPAVAHRLQRVRALALASPEGDRLARPRLRRNEQVAFASLYLEHRLLHRREFRISPVREGSGVG